MRRARLIALAACALGGLAAAPDRAEVDEVCNHTSFVVEAAKAWRTDAGMAARGWTLIPPGACQSVPAPPDTRQYLYARTTLAYSDGVREWRGDEAVCVDDADFAYEGGANCAAQGMQARGFRELSPDERQRAVLVEPDEWGDAARDAGLQRLLRAAGYQMRVIDGVAGRNTRARIAEFEADIGERFGDDSGALMRAIHERALERNASAGLSVCNEAGAPVAVATGSTRGPVDESRGWWRIEPGECARVLGGWLEEGEVFVYAKRLAGEGDPQPLIGGEDAFCIAPARFRAEARSDCAGRGYQTAGFRPAPEIEDGSSTLTVTEADFSAPLRRAQVEPDPPG